MSKEIACFICARPYQIITAIHLVICNNIDADLFIVDSVHNAEEIGNKISRYRIFTNVKIVHQKDFVGVFKSTKLQYVYNAVTLLFHIDSLVSRYIDSDRIYNTIYISSRTPFSRTFLMYFQKHYSNTLCVFFEDGLGSYYNRGTIHEKLMDRIVGKCVIGRAYQGTDVKSILLYSPQLFRTAVVNYSSDIECHEIPKWPTDSKWVGMLNDIFGFSEEDRIKESVIILDCIAPNRERKSVDKFYTKIAELVGTNNLIIKQHPFNERLPDENLKYYSKFDIPFELICLNVDMSNKLLITISSTSVSTPVLLFGKEPYVLTLSETDLNFDSKSKVNFQDIANLYKDSGRFMAAKSLNEALEFVEIYKKENMNQRK